MSALFTADETLFTEACDVIRLYTGEKHIEQLKEAEVRPEGLTFHILPCGDYTQASVFEDGRLLLETQCDTAFLPLRRDAQRSAVRQKRHQAKRALHDLLRQALHRTLPWGSLTGIRPVKLFRELADLYGRKTAREEFLTRYAVTQEKTALSARIAGIQKETLEKAGSGDCAYIGIPFCPSRCRYCSFIAQDVKGARNVRSIYPEALLRELTAAGKLASVTALYIGGGTPTTYSVPELRTLIETAQRIFPAVREFTVEAGRPDTITPENLRLFSGLGVGRLSINVQSIHDATLQRIGRAHSAADFLRAMQMARQEGSFLINTDMILGLPGEHQEDVLTTLEAIIGQGPENITVHALAVKNAAALATEKDWIMMDASEAEQTAALAARRLAQAGYRPYYLYRQKYMSGNLENVGYTKTGAACLYNILNMEELASVYAFGAGAISKRVLPEEGRIERAANVKDTQQYVSRVDEMISRKRRLFSAARSS